MAVAKCVMESIGKHDASNRNWVATLLAAIAMGGFAAIVGAFCVRLRYVVSFVGVVGVGVGQGPREN